MRPASPRTHVSRRLRRTLALLVAAALLGPTGAGAASRMFSSGSLIIPASVEYQTNDGILSAYGLVYSVLWKNAERTKPVTIYWVVQPNKLSQYRCNTMTNALPKYSPTYNDNDGCDFAVQKASGQPVARVNPAMTGEEESFLVSNISYSSSEGPTRASTKHAIGSSTTVVKYLGGAWVIDSTERQAFLDMLKTIPELARFHKDGTGSDHFVEIHSARANFTAPVASVLTRKPPPVALTGSNETKFLENVLLNAGICGAISNCRGTYSATGFTSGVVYDYYPNATDLLGATPGYPDGRLNGTVNGNAYGTYWAGDGSNPAAADLARVATFLDRGNHVFVADDAIENVETRRPFHTTTGVNDFNPNIATYEDCNDAAVPATVDGVPQIFRGGGFNCLIYAGANQPYAQTGNFLFEGGQGDFKGYTPRAAFVTGVTKVLAVKNGPTVSSAWNYQNDPAKGLLLYLAGHKFDNGRFWGQRIILNTIFSKLIGLTGMELSRSEPVGYKNTAASPVTARVYQGTYVQQPLPDSNDVITYNAAAPQFWQFPYTSGHLYEYEVGNIATSAQTFGSNKNWDSALRLPLPRDRLIYTIVGGSAHLGWKAIPFHHGETGPSCTDRDGDGKCDLSQLLAACNSAGVTSAALQDRSVNGAQAQKLGMLVQQVRGHCSAHDPRITGTAIYEPADAQCDDLSLQSNRARLGGIDHSSPAVVGPSRYLTSPPWTTRPVVAYAAGADGMLHAFYVSAHDGSSSASWSAEGQSIPAGVQRGQELWAFVPPGQVCGLAFNNAVVDGSVNVVDVFGDFPYDANDDTVIDWTSASERPNHVMRWRTVLTATAGPGGSELFALDVTNPLKPVLLWHVGGPTEHDGRWDRNGDGVFGAGEVFDAANPATYAIKWFDWDDGDAGTAHIPTDYNTTSASVISSLKSGRYDYRNLGLSYSTAVSKRWVGGRFQYLLLVATNAADYANASAPTGYRGAEVFAIDLVTGQKQWQWEHRYLAGDGPGVDNSIPPRMALGDIDANGSTERIYVGDLEGRLWELSAADGRNVNYLPDRSGVHRSFPLFGTPAMTGTGGGGASAATRELFEINGTTPLAQQPLTTPIGQGRFTSVPSAAQPYLVNRLSMVLGTMGVDWSIAPYEAGNLFVVPAWPDGGTRLAPPIDLGAARDPLKYGILLPSAVWTIPLTTGERIYGMPRVVNNTILFNTAFGSFTGDISSSIADLGYLRIVTGDGSGVHVDTRANDSKSFGGVMIMEGAVVVTTDTSIRVLSSPPASISGGGVAQQTFNRVTPALMKTWEIAWP